MTNTMEVVRGLFLLVPVAILFSIGSLIALNSGAGQTGSGFAMRRYAGNFGSLVLQVACVLMIFMAVQQWVGLGLGLGH